MGGVYEITCNKCQDPVTQEEGTQRSRQPGGQLGPKYVGMTMTSSHCRMSAHLQGQASGSQSNPLHRHDQDSHAGQVQQYTMRILAKERKVLPLTIMEALYIEGQSPGTSINERNEYGRGKLVRMVAAT